MTEPQAIIVPLLNPNEPEAMVAQLLVQEGDQVEAGASLATLETTKTTSEITAEQEGFIVGLTVDQGQTLSAGEILLWIAPKPDWLPPEKERSDESLEQVVGSDLRLTQPARKLAEQADLDLAELPTGPLITEQWLQDWIASREDLPDIDPAKILVYGGGGHGRAVIELIQAIGDYQVIGLIDDGLSVGTKIMDVEVLAGGGDLSQLRRQGVGQAANAVGGIGDISSRVQVARRLNAAGFSQPNLIHPTAFVEPSTQFQDGIQVFPQAYIGSQAKLARGVIVNTAAVISHDCDLGEYVNIAPGALLAGAVQIGPRTLIGMGATINLEVVIGPDSRVGNSAVIKQSMPAGNVVPAGSLWPRRQHNQESK